MRKIFEALLTATFAGLAGFMVFIWTEVEGLKKKLDGIEAAGAVELAKIEECKALSLEIIRYDEAINYTTKLAAEKMFASRGCEAVKRETN
jgi:hypothetical protein